MKAIRRSLLFLLILGLAGLTMVIEQSKREIRKRLSEARAMQSHQAPLIDSIGLAKSKRLSYFRHLFFWNYSSRLCLRWNGFLCQLSALPGPEMEFRSFQSRADANGFHFTLTGLIRGSTAAPAMSLFRFFKEDVERLDGILEITAAETFPDAQNDSVLSFILKGAVGLE